MLLNSYLVWSLAQSGFVLVLVCCIRLVDMAESRTCFAVLKLHTINNSVKGSCSLELRDPRLYQDHRTTLGICNISQLNIIISTAFHRCRQPKWRRFSLVIRLSWMLPSLELRMKVTEKFRKLTLSLSQKQRLKQTS